VQRPETGGEPVVTAEAGAARRGHRI